jgi:hypothetical protein
MSYLDYTMPGIQPAESDLDIVLDNILYEIMIQCDMTMDSAQAEWDRYSPELQEKMIRKEIKSLEGDMECNFN